MKSIRENAGVLILCIAELLVGILLLINPVGFTAGIVIAAGVLLIASGLQSVVRYVTTDPATGVREQGLARGLTASLLGETTAETKVTLNQLKTRIMGGEEEKS